MSEKIKVLTEAKKQQVEIKKENKEIESKMFSNARTALNVDDECIKFTGLNRTQILQEVAKAKKACKDQAKTRINDFFREACLADIDLLFDTVFTSLCCFTMNETYIVYEKILARVEKIVAENDNFYTMAKAEKNNLFESEIVRWIPDWQLPYYRELLTKEKINSFSLYNEFIEKIQAQDFILRGSFINIQYDNNGNFIIVNFPDFLKKINTLFISHLVTTFTYRHNLKFGPANAIVDFEDQGFRFNMIESTLDTSKETSIFIRKNVSKSKSTSNSKVNFDFGSYYYNLFSELPDNDEFANDIIEKCNRARKKLEYKFDGFKSANYEEVEYGRKWFETTITNPRGTTMMDVAKYALTDIIKKYVADKNPLIVGPTGSGKSTLLSKILSEKQYINPEQNLLTIEDTPELNIPFAISYVTNSKYKIHDIFVATLRQNPSRVIIGETRGIEIIDILETCLTSKSGTTIHATDMNKMIMRIKMMVGKEMESSDLFYLLTSAVDIIVFIIARHVTGVYVRNSKAFDGDVIECYDRLV